LSTYFYSGHFKNKYKTQHMQTQDFTLTLAIDQSPETVFNAINNVRGWWSEEIEGNTTQAGDEFTYRYKDMHRCKIKLAAVVPGKKVSWLVLENFFNFTKDNTEWVNTTIDFEISRKDNKTHLLFRHQGLVPQYECYSACSKGWTQYIRHSLFQLITSGKGQPNSGRSALTALEVAGRFHQLAQQEQWFPIQDEFFSDDVKSIEPAGSPWLQNAEGKAAVRKKADDWVKRIEAVHRLSTTEPVVAGNHFAVAREMDITVQGHGRILINEIMLYEVRDGRIVSEQFFY
jgi:uncharacterized protein YndB with AHSA1/START domain